MSPSIATAVLAGLLSTAAAPAAAQPPAPPAAAPQSTPPLVTVPKDKIRVIGGEHCGTPDTLTVDVSPDYAELYFLYPRLAVSAPAAGSTATGECDIVLRIDVTPGWQLRLADLRIQGMSTLSRGSTGTATTTMYLVGSHDHQKVSATKQLSGPTNAAQGWDAVTESATGFSPCESSIVLHVSAGVTSSRGGEDAGIAKVSMTNAATGAHGANTASLRYQRCGQ